MDPEVARLLAEFVEKIGLLRRDMRHNKEFERYEARFVRIEQKFSALAELISRDDPELALALRTSFLNPTRPLAFRNAEHQKEIKARKPDPENN